MAACAALFAPTCRKPCARCSPTAPGGLADPGPVLQTFATDRALGREFHLRALVPVVDAVGGAANIERMPEARKQVALADRIVLTKSDLADAVALHRLRVQITALSPAPLAIADNGAVEP